MVPNQLVIKGDKRRHGLPSLPANVLLWRQAMDEGREGTSSGNAQVFNTLDNLYIITRSSRAKGQLERRNPSDSVLVTFGGTDRVTLIY